jgi:hypothetical protein
MSVVDFSNALTPTEEIQLTVTDPVSGREPRGRFGSFRKVTSCLCCR